MGWPYSAAAARNRDPIRAVLARYFDAPGTVLEIGSGTGQHAVYLAAQLPHLTWRASDQAEALDGLAARLQAEAPGLAAPERLDVHDRPWPLTAVDYVFSANTAHILDWAGVEALFQGIGTVLRPGGRFALYGPFAYDGEHTGPGNQAFDAALRRQGQGSGIRDVRALEPLARSVGLEWLADEAMPADNRTLIWRCAGSE